MNFVKYKVRLSKSILSIVSRCLCLIYMQGNGLRSEIYLVTIIFSILKVDLRKRKTGFV